MREGHRTVKSVHGYGPKNKRLLIFLLCLLEFRINFQVAISADYSSQAPLNSRSLRFLFTRGLSGLLPTANPQEGTLLLGDSEPIPEPAPLLTPCV